MDKSENDLPCGCCACDCCMPVLSKICGCCYCCHQKDKARYPHIHYGQLSSEHRDPDDHQAPPKTPVPIDTIFTHPQKYRQFTIHPQLEDSEKNKEPIIEQPRRRGISMTLQQDSFSFNPDDEDITEEESEYEEDDQEPVSDLSLYRSMEDIGVDLGFVDSCTGGYYQTTDFYNYDTLLQPSVASEKGSPSFNKRSTYPGAPRIRSYTATLRSLSSVVDPPPEKKIDVIKSPPTPPLPGVHFSLYFDETKSSIIVHVNQAVRLPTNQPVESSNPFIQAYLLPKKSDVQQSHSIERTHDPVFDCVFKFSEINPSILNMQIVVIRLYVNDTSHFIGGILHSLEEANLFGDKIISPILEFDEDECQKDSFQGDILVTLCYRSQRGVLEVLVLEVSNLKKQDILGNPNPYVKINLIHCGQRVSKWKTLTKKGTQNPIFNELCEIDVSKMNIEDVQFDLILMNYDRFGHNSEIGSVSFGDNVSHNSGQKHWRRVMIETNTELSSWHAIKHADISYSKPSKVQRPKSSRHRPMKVIPSGMQI